MKTGKLEPGVCSADAHTSAHDILVVRCGTTGCLCAGLDEGALRQLPRKGGQQSSRGAARAACARGAGLGAETGFLTDRCTRCRGRRPRQRR